MIAGFGMLGQPIPAAPALVLGVSVRGFAGTTSLLLNSRSPNELTGDLY